LVHRTAKNVGGGRTRGIELFPFFLFLFLFLSRFFNFSYTSCPTSNDMKVLLLLLSPSFVVSSFFFFYFVV